MKHIYIAGPLYGSGHQDNNIRTVLRVASLVEQEGFIPFVPHLYFFWNLMYRHPREFWLKLDKEWLIKCDGMIRIEGESPGSNLEERWCEEAWLPYTPIPYTEDNELLTRSVREALGRLEKCDDGPG